MSEISTQQLAANRENAKLGGVRTEAGKAVSRHNALKHGLLSKEVLLTGEDEGALLELGKRLRSELKPATELEVVLVDRIVSGTWRLRRALRAEKEMIDEDCNFEDMSGKIQTKSLGKAFSYDFINHDSYGKFIRYETAIERSIYKALHELQRLQGTRNGLAVPLPLAIDVDVSGGTE